MGTTQLDGARQLRFTGDLDLQTHKIHNLVDPTSAQDAATKNYVDANSVTYANHIYNETPSGTINGTNTTFTLANTPHSGTVTLYLNGLRQNPGASNDYTVSSSTITFNAAPVTGDILLADYLK